MADKVTIVNRALALVGAEPITSLTDNTPEAKIANRLYDESRKSILSETLWNSATKRAALNQAVVTLPFVLDDATFVFQLPSDIIRIFGVSADNINWRIEQQLLIADTNEIGILYVYNQTDTTKWSSSFVDAFADKLAADMAYSITNSSTMASDLLKKYDGVSLPRAMTENAQVGTPPDIKDDLWSYARFGFSPVGSRGRRIA